jgi:hypothetical protein
LSLHRILDPAKALSGLLENSVDSPRLTESHLIDARLSHVLDFLGQPNWPASLDWVVAGPGLTSAPNRKLACNSHKPAISQTQRQKVEPCEILGWHQRNFRLASPDLRSVSGLVMSLHSHSIRRASINGRRARCDCPHKASSQKWSNITTKGEEKELKKTVPKEISTEKTMSKKQYCVPDATQANTHSSRHADQHGFIYLRRETERAQQYLFSFHCKKRIPLWQLILGLQAT